MTVALIVLVFIVLCALMYTKKMNAMFALPIMALLIAIIAGIPWADTVEGEATVAGIQSLLFINGPLRLGSTIITFIFGAILSQQVKNAGIAETPVSYTHLDVYKRQTRARSKSPGSQSCPC